MEYRYHLLKYSGKASRLTCPQCGRQRCFTPYVDADDNIIGPEYGRCDHESSCGYVKYPPSDYSLFMESYHTVGKKPKPRRFKPILEDSTDVCTIPMGIVMKTVRTEPPSDFLSFLRSIFDASTVARVAGEYCLGVTKSRDVIFYQIDTKGRCRTGKVMKYDPVTGHRIKDDGTGTPITWVHKAAERPYLGIIVSDLLEKNATPEDRAAHIDIADLLIRWMQERKDDLPEDVSEPPPDTPASENPVFLEIKKHISPEYYAEVLALIEELGLEVVHKETI